MRHRLETRRAAPGRTRPRPAGRAGPLAAIVLGFVATATASGQGYVFATIEGSDLTGLGVASISAGDLDGDGIPDLVVGAPTSAGGRGRIQIHSGATGGTIRTLLGAEPGARLGSSLAAIGDLDGDGVWEFLAGAPLADGPAGVDSGRAFLYSGADGSPLLVLEGGAAGERAGEAVARAGILDADLVMDLAVGAPWASLPGLAQAGRVRAFSGADGGALLSIDGVDPGGRFGSSVAGPGDLSGDGVADLATGSPGANRITVVSGASGAVVFTAFGLVPTDRFGASLAAVGDTNGDGLSDLLVGAPQGVAPPVTFPSGGYARLLSGAGGGLLVEMFGPGAADAFGGFVGSAGDVDANGVGDLVVGARQPGFPGIVSPGEGFVSIFSGVDGAPLYGFSGEEIGDAFGASASVVGDLDNDGVKDLLIGAPQPGAAPWVPSANGYAEIVSGASGTSLFRLDARTECGTALAAVGDLNADGRNDWVVGSPAAAGAAGARGGVVRAVSGTGAVLFAAEGAGATDRFGAALCGPGDVDGDGVADIAVGAPTADPGGLANAGEVRVLSGVNGSLLVSIAGGAPGDAFGSDVAAVGDCDGDGIPDLLVGAPLADPGGASSTGEVRVLSGGNGSWIATLPGVAAGDAFGSAVAGVDDLDGDGTGDLLVGAPGADSAGAVNAGAAFAYSGATRSPLFAVPGATAGAQLATSIAGTGDANGDGIPDVVVGAPFGFGPSGAFPGRALVVSGSDGAVLYDRSGDASGDRFGWSVAGLADLDGDGVGDFVVGAPGALNGLGLARVYSTVGALEIESDYGLEEGDEFGHDVASAGDLDADGFFDFLVGAPQPGGGAATVPPSDGYAQAVSRLGLPPGAFRFGPDCPGSGGFVPRISTLGGAPAPGNGAFAVVLTRTLGAANVVLLAGASSQAWGGLPLPLDLAPVGSPGCFLLVSPDLIDSGRALGVGAGAGVRFRSIAVPADPGLSGSTVYFEGYVVDPGPAPAPGATTQGLAIVVP